MPEARLAAELTPSAETRPDMNTPVYKWRVTHPERGSVEVEAVSRYWAVVAAAKAWGERWTQIARLLTVERLEEVGVK